MAIFIAISFIAGLQQKPTMALSVLIDLALLLGQQLDHFQTILRGPKTG